MFANQSDLPAFSTLSACSLRLHIPVPITLNGCSSFTAGVTETARLTTTGGSDRWNRVCIQGLERQGEVLPLRKLRDENWLGSPKADEQAAEVV